MTPWVGPGNQFMTQWMELHYPVMTFWVRPYDHIMKSLAIMDYLFDTMTKSRCCNYVTMSETRWSSCDTIIETRYCIYEQIKLWERPDDQFIALWVWPDSVFLSLGEEPDYQFITLWVRRCDQIDIMCDEGWSLYDTKSESRQSVYDSMSKTKW